LLWPLAYTTVCTTVQALTKHCNIKNYLLTFQNMNYVCSEQTSVERYHGSTAALLYHFLTVPVPWSSWYFLVPQCCKFCCLILAHNCRNSTAVSHGLINCYSVLQGITLTRYRTHPLTSTWVCWCTILVNWEPA